MLAAERPHAVVAATDISRQALLVARANAQRHNVSKRIHFVQTDLASGLDMKADLIVSNPPYVPHRDAAILTIDVARYEPATALLTLSRRLRYVCTESTERCRGCDSRCARLPDCSA